MSAAHHPPVVLITGASSGFGRLTAMQLARRGANVVATMRDPDRGVELRDEAARDGLTVDVVALDVVDPASVRDAVAGVLDTHGTIDVLVNNAGIGIRGALEDATDEDVRAIYEVNVFGLVRVTQAVLPAMRAQRSGTIVNISSIAGLFSTPYASVYSSSKAAVEAISDALHYELAPFGVRVAVVEPGIFPTDIALHRRPNQRAESSPYRHDEQRWNEVYARRPGTDGPPPDLDDAVRVIAAAAMDPSFPLRALVGRDAQAIGAMRRELDDVAFETALRDVLEYPLVRHPPDDGH